jgi:ribonuclease HII
MTAAARKATTAVKRETSPAPAAVPGKRARRSATDTSQAALCFDVPGQLACGVDEAGRGPLAGSVVAAAVILDPARPIVGLNDSKVLSAKTRERLYDEIVERALAYSIAEASVAEIDSLNILHATMLAMKRAVEGLKVTPDIAYIDGNRCPAVAVRAEAVVGGDAFVPAISAASILAKVTRDRQLAEMHEAHPHYGFNAHMGYGTAQHLAALREHGPCAHHRRSFAPVREAWARVEAANGHVSGLSGTDTRVLP